MASRVLGLSLRHLSDDMLALHGYPVLVAESFVDPSRFSGACYRASNWHALGPTRGCSRRSGGSARFTRTGQPKEVFVRELCEGAAAKLRGAPRGEKTEDGILRRRLGCGSGTQIY